MALSSKNFTVELTDTSHDDFVDALTKERIPMTFKEYEAELKQGKVFLSPAPILKTTAALGSNVMTVTVDDPVNSSFSEKTLMDAVKNLLSTDKVVCGVDTNVDLAKGQLIVKTKPWWETEDFSHKMFKKNDYATGARVDGFRQSAKLVCDRCAMGVRHINGSYASHVDGSPCVAQRIHDNVRQYGGVTELIEPAKAGVGSYFNLADVYTVAAHNSHINFIQDYFLRPTPLNVRTKCPVCEGLGKSGGEACWHCEGEGVDPIEE